MKKGFVPVFCPTNFVDCKVALVGDRYQGLASSLLEFLIFKASYRDTVNCTFMYTRFGFVFEDHSSTPLSPVQNDPHAWYLDYSSALAVRFIANYPSTPIYSLDVAKIKAKYSSKSTDTCSAAFWSIIEMAHSRKQFWLGPSSPGDQQKSVSSPNDASVLSAEDDADGDAELIPKNGGQKGEGSTTRIRRRVVIFILPFLIRIISTMPAFKTRPVKFVWTRNRWSRMEVKN
jgi:hypothetical protein